MKFHICENEFGEPLAHVEMSVFDALTISSALHTAMTKRITWIMEQKSSKYAEDRLRAFGDLASVHGAFDMIQQTMWPLHEAFVDGMDDDCDEESE